MADTAELLASLRDVREPSAPEATSLTSLSVTGLIVVALILLLCWVWHRHRTRWIRQSLAELGTIRSRFAQSSSEHSKQNSSNHPAAIALADIAKLLRRIALYFNDSAEDVRQLSGKQWIAHLDRLFRTDYFTHGDGQIFGDRLYSPDATINWNDESTNIEQLEKQIRKQIKRCRFKRLPKQKTAKVPLLKSEVPVLPQPERQHG